MVQAEVITTGKENKTEEGETTATDIAALSDKELSELRTGEQPEEKVPEDNKDEVNKDEKPEEKEETPEETITRLTTELEKTKETSENRGDYIKKRDTEVGELRKQIQGLKDQKVNLSDQDFNDNPAASTEASHKNVQKDIEIEKLEVEATMLENEKIILESIPNLPELLDDIAELAKADGFTDKQVKLFKENPYLENPDTLKQYVKRLGSFKKAKEQELAIAELRKQVDGLKANPAQLLKKIKDASRQTPVTTAGGEDSDRETAVVSRSQLIKMTDSELTAYRKGLKT